MDKEGVVYINNKILLGNEKEWNLAICNNVMEMEGIMLSEINESEKDRYMFPLMWNLRNLTEDHGGREGEK